MRCELLWKKLLEQDKDLSFRFDERCTVRAADDKREVPRACRHSWFRTMLEYQLELRTGVCRRIFRCTISGCEHTFNSMSQLHRHQASKCIPAHECDAEMSIRVRAYTKCVPCGWSAGTWRAHGLPAAMDAKRRHFAELHGNYECTEAWCTTALCEGISRVCDVPQSGSLAANLGICLGKCSDRIRTLLGQPYSKADVAALAQQVKTELNAVLPVAARFDFLSASGLKEHIADMHTKIVRMHDVPADCTVAALTSHQPADMHTRCSVNAFVRRPDDLTVHRMHTLVHMLYKNRRCNANGVFVALVVPAHRYDGDQVYYLQELVESHCCLYTKPYDTYSAVVAEVVCDLCHLLAVCTRDLCHLQAVWAGNAPRLVECVRRAMPGHTKPEWWADEANSGLITRIFQLCARAHSCIQGHFGDTAVLRALRDSTKEPAARAVHATLRLLPTSRCMRLLHRLLLLAKHTEYPDLASLAKRTAQTMHNSQEIEWRTLSAIVTEMDHIAPQPHDFKRTRDEVLIAFRELYHFATTRPVLRATLYQLLQMPEILRVGHILDPAAEGSCLAIGSRRTDDGVLHTSVDVLSKYAQLTSDMEPVDYHYSLQSLADTMHHRLQAFANTGAQDRPAYVSTDRPP
jgi:hypothetical protein